MSVGNETIPGDHSVAWDSYQRMRVKLASRINRDLTAATGLSEADYEILTALTQQNEAIRSITLRCGLEWEKSRLSHQLRRMEQRGLIARFDCEEDSRSSVVSITDEGRKAHAVAKTTYDAAVQRYVTDVLPSAHLDTLGEIADAVLRQLDEPHRA